MAKLQGNAQRDQRRRRKLAALGWRVAVVWECALKGERAAKGLARLERLIAGASAFLEIEGH